ncbi:creatininase family protein [Nonomuraea typhae]|uniref:creatininase family protein n=1 Tax=Nonomuraea typhae TaxID=2603600 RepID=UPI0015E1C707|nr:creatininase family protein [Nonomuraea typhae]
MNDLATMVAEEAARALETARLALLPIGATEQHGRHLTLETDYAIARAFARRLAADLDGDAVLCPGLPYGLSEHHLGFPGTMTLRPETLMAILRDLAESLAAAGVRKVLVVNGHGGNVDAVRLAARTLRRDHGVVMAHVMWAGLAADVIPELMGSERYGHACEGETSVAMVLVPHLVRAERLAEPAAALPILPHTVPHAPRVDLHYPYHRLSASGALGDARLASEELGHTIVNTAYARALEFARAFAAEEV